MGSDELEAAVRKQIYSSQIGGMNANESSIKEKVRRWGSGRLTGTEANLTIFL